MLFTGGVLLALLAITWIVWDQYSRRELQSRLDTYRRAGEPGKMDDLQPAAIPDDQNAAAMFLKAADAIDTQSLSPSLGSQSYGEDLPYPPEWHAVARSAIQANSLALALARQASLRSTVAWPLQLKSGILQGMASDLNGQRHLACLLGDAALYEHFQGDDSRAFADIRVLLRQAHALYQRPFLVSNLVGRSVEDFALARIEIMAGDLHIGPQPTELSQDQARALISDLLSGPQAASSFAQAIRTDRVFRVEAAENLYSSSLLFKPMLRLGAMQAMDRQTHLAQASLLPTLSAARAALPPRSPLQETANQLLRVWGSKEPVDPAFRTWALASADDASDILLVRFHRHICEQRMAALMLAFRTYVIDQGRYPQTLRELVPAYLPALPADPMAADGRPFGYFITSGGKRPILYSVGDDSIDQTQDRQPVLSPHLLKGEQIIRRDQPDDQYRDLSSWIYPGPTAEERRAEEEMQRMMPKSGLPAGWGATTAPSGKVAPSFRPNTPPRRTRSEDSAR